MFTSLDKVRKSDSFLSIYSQPYVTFQCLAKVQCIQNLKEFLNQLFSN